MADNTSTLSPQDQATIAQAQQNQSNFFNSVGGYGSNLLSAILGQASQSQGNGQQVAPVQTGMPQSNITNGYTQGPQAINMNQGYSQQITPADDIFQKSAQDALQDKADDMHANMTPAQLINLVNQHGSMASSITAPTTQAPAQGNPAAGVIPNQQTSPAQQAPVQGQTNGGLLSMLSRGAQDVGNAIPFGKDIVNGFNGLNSNTNAQGNWKPNLWQALTAAGTGLAGGNSGQVMQGYQDQARQQALNPTVIAKTGAEALNTKAVARAQQMENEGIKPVQPGDIYAAKYKQFLDQQSNIKGQIDAQEKALEDINSKIADLAPKTNQFMSGNAKQAYQEAVTQRNDLEASLRGQMDNNGNYLKDKNGNELHGLYGELNSLSEPKPLTRPKSLIDNLADAKQLAPGTPYTYQGKNYIRGQ